MASTILVLVAVLTVAAIGLTVATWIVYVPKVLHLLRGVPWMIGHNYPPVSNSQDHDVLSRDGTQLRVTSLPHTAGRRSGSVLFIHGLGEDRWTVAPYAAALRGRGFDVYSFDMRNHGESQSQKNYVPRPWVTVREVEDVLAVIDFVASRTEAPDGCLALIGVSKGGNAALCAAAESPRVCAVITDGAFPTGGMLRYYMRRFMRTHPQLKFLADRLPDACLISYCAWGKLLFRVFDNAEVVNVEQAVRRVEQPVFMIHAERDGYVPEQAVRELRRCVSGRSKLWIVPGVNHNGAATQLTEEYSRRVVRFLSRRFRDVGRHEAGASNSTLELPPLSAHRRDASTVPDVAEDAARKV